MSEDVVVGGVASELESPAIVSPEPLAKRGTAGRM